MSDANALANITIDVEDPRQPEMEVLISELNDFLLALSPPDACHQLTIDQMAAPDVTVFVARNGDGAAIGCGALRYLPDDWGDRWGEVKRMYVSPSLRGTGIGRVILDRIEAEARATGLRHLVLETGLAETHRGAHSTYSKAGFMPRGAYGDYPVSDWSVFMEKSLETKGA